MGYTRHMKALLLIVVLLLVCMVLFLAGVFSPRSSKRMQGKVDGLTKKGESKSDKKAGRLGDLTRDGLEKARSTADASARAGRTVNEKLTDKR